jgi:hypothetical protein
MKLETLTTEVAKHIVLSVKVVCIGKSVLTSSNETFLSNWAEVHE